MRCCHSCGTQVPGKERVGRREACEKCGADLHCCLNCRLHDPWSANECREPGTEVVRDRDAGNFCDSFEFRLGPKTGGDPAAEAKAKLDALFKK